MIKIFKDQSALRIVLNTHTDLSGIEKAVIKYKKPDGTRSFFSAGVSNVEKGIINHECIEGEIDKCGWWTFWAHITFDDGRVAAGDVAKVFVWEEGGSN
jgi:hypothetical protein